MIYFGIMVRGVDSELVVLKTCESPPLFPIGFVCNSTEKEDHIDFNDNRVGVGKANII